MPKDCEYGLINDGNMAFVPYPVTLPMNSTHALRILFSTKLCKKKIDFDTLRPKVAWYDIGIIYGISE